MMGRGYGPNGARKGVPPAMGTPPIARPLPQPQASSESSSPFDALFTAVVNKVMPGKKPQQPSLTVSGTITSLNLRSEKLLQERQNIIARIQMRLKADPSANVLSEQQELKSIDANRTRIAKQLKMLKIQKQSIEMQHDTKDFMLTMQVGVEELKKGQASLEADKSLDVDDIMADFDDLVKTAVDTNQNIMDAFTEVDAHDFYDSNMVGDDGIPVGESIDSEIEAMRAQATKSNDQDADDWSLSLKSEAPEIPKTPATLTSASVRSGSGSVSHPQVAPRISVDPIPVRVTPPSSNNNNNNSDMAWLLGD